MRRAALLLVLPLLLGAGTTARDRAYREADRHLAEGTNALSQGLPCERAVSEFQQALPLLRRALDPASMEVADCLNQLAVAYSLCHTPESNERALDYFGQELTLRKATPGPDTEPVARNLIAAADLHDIQGRPEQAEQLYRRSLAFYEGQDRCSDEVAGLLREIAGLRGVQGDPAGAEASYRRALEIMDSDFHPEPGVRCVQPPSGGCDPCWRRRRHAADQQEVLRRNGTEAVQMPPYLIQYAIFLFWQERYAEARPLLERALALGERRHGPRSWALFVPLDFLGAIAQAQGRYAEARATYQRALSIVTAELQRSDPSNDSYRFQLQYALCSIAYDVGAYDQSEPACRQALQMAETTFGAAHPFSSQDRAFLGRVLVARGRVGEVLPLYAKALRDREEDLRRRRLALSEAELLNVLGIQGRLDDGEIYSLLLERPGDPAAQRLALATALLHKGRSVDMVAAVSRAVFERAGAEDRERFGRLRELHGQYARLFLNGPGALSGGDYQKRLQDLATQASAVERQLGAHLGAVLQQPPGAEDIVDRVAAVLPGKAALVEVVSFRRLDYGAAASRPPWGAERYLALLLLPGGGTAAVDLGESAPIDAAVRRLLLALTDPRSRPLPPLAQAAGCGAHLGAATRPDSEAVAYLPPAREVFDRVLRPLLPALGERRHLLLSLDGQLQLIPFDALHDGSGFVIDRYRIGYLTSGRDLLRSGGRPANTAVLLADPDFAAPSSAQVPGRRGGTWQRLPGTRQEAEAIHQLVPQAQMLVGSAATKAALLGLTTPAILHVATHGWFLEDQPIGAAATRGLGIDTGLLGHAGRPLGLAPDPLLRSALVLAGANVHGPQDADGPGRSEGLATALEIAGMDLWGTRLVVLSACDTGRGEVKQGQGVYGLRRAVMVAGAETLVTSLWQVDDQATRDLMTLYYQKLVAKGGRVEAMREAMQAVRARRPHPYYWAPFIVLGRGGPLQ